MYGITPKQFHRDLHMCLQTPYVLAFGRILEYSETANCNWCLPSVKYRETASFCPNLIWVCAKPPAHLSQVLFACVIWLCRRLQWFFGQLHILLPRCDFRSRASTAVARFMAGSGGLTFSDSNTTNTDSSILKLPAKRFVWKSFYSS